MMRPLSATLVAAALGGALSPGSALAQVAARAAASAAASQEPAPRLDRESLPPGMDSSGRADEERGLQGWPGVSLGWDVHAEAISLFKHYTVGDRGAWYNGQGAGGGLTVSLHFRPPGALANGALRWVEFELGAGSSVHAVRWEEGREARRGTDFIDSHTSAILGLHVATGSWSSGSGVPWSGAVLGLAWMPTYVHFFGNDDFRGGGKLHHAGLRLSVDWGRISPSAKGLVPGLRAFLTWLPYIGSLPTSVSAGVGCVFY